MDDITYDIYGVCGVLQGMDCMYDFTSGNKMYEYSWCVMSMYTTVVVEGRILYDLHDRRRIACLNGLWLCISTARISVTCKGRRKEGIQVPAVQRKHSSGTKSTCESIHFDLFVTTLDLGTYRLDKRHATIISA
jgi:hypothetical protein